MPAPTKYPDWATGGTNTVEPPSGKITSGWIPAEQPPSGWFNWWQNLVGAWTRWFDTSVTSLTSRADAVDDKLSTQDDINGLVSDALERAAYIDQENTFAHGPQWIDPPLDAIGANALISTHRKPEDADLPGDPAPSANRWFPLIHVPTQGAAKSGLFIGQSPYNGALVSNARWDVLTQKWVQTDPAYASAALVSANGQWWTSNQPAGASPWADWPKAAGGDFVCSGNLAATLWFVYNSPPVITKGISPNDFRGTCTAINEGQQMAFAPAQSGIAVIRAPHDGFLGQIKLKMSQSGGDASITIKLKHRYSVNFNDASLPGYDTVATFTGTLVDGFPPQNITLNFGGMHVDKNENYSIYVLNGNSSPGTAYLHAAEFAYTDPGPRNH